MIKTSTFILLSTLSLSIYSQTISDIKSLKKLTREALSWQDKREPFAGIELIFDDDKGIATGLDMDVLKGELKNLELSGFFADEFLKNYRNYVVSIDEKIKSGEYQIELQDLPPYAGANPWCNCQDTPYDNPWEAVEINIISIDNKSAEYTWTWGKSDWSEYFNYRVKAVKINGKWQISYLEGFDN